MGRDVSGRKAIVTGAASGIGAAAVARLLADGCHVLAVDIVSEGLAGTHNLTADLAKPEEPLRIAQSAQSVLGGLDILINNAGVNVPSSFDDMTEDMWALALDVNVSGTMRLIRACLPMLRKSQAGRVINTGSILSQYGDASLVAYSTSKHAVVGLTRALAMAVGRDGITVNCVQPGPTVTGMTKPKFESNPEFADYYRDRSALGRLGLPEDIADVMAFLASDDARFITGQGIMVDGGVTVHS